MNNIADNVPTSDTVPPVTSEDAAWASLFTPLSPSQLEAFCQDTERLFRINPYLEFRQWQQLTDNGYRISGRNLSQDPAFEFDTELTISGTPQERIVYFSQGLKTSTTFRIEPVPQGSKLTIIDDYSGSSEQAREQRLGEVDKSLARWAQEIQVYILMWQRWSWIPPWRWYMRKVWQPLKPTARRITYMLIWITAAEIAFIAMGFIIYWSEYT